MNKEKLKNKTIQYAYIALGVIFLDVGFYFFVEPVNLVLGGMMGLSVILEPYYSMLGAWATSSLFLLVGNVVVLIIGGLMLGKDFFIKTIFSSLFSPFVVFIFERTCDPNYFLSTTSEAGRFIVATICATLLSGIGLGIALKNNGSTGGLDVIQKIMSRYLHIPYSKTMYLTDWVIVLFSGFTFIGGFSYNLEIVIYGIIGVLGISLIIDMIILNAKSRRTCFIVTMLPDAVKQIIYDKIDRGVTLVDARGGYTNEGKTLLICTMEKNEAYLITELLKVTDPDAFCFVSATKEIVGEYKD